MTRLHHLLSLSLVICSLTLDARIEHGTIHVSTGFSGSSGLALNSDTSEHVFISTRGSTNKGDYALEFGTSDADDDTELGVVALMMGGLQQ